MKKYSRIVYVAAAVVTWIIFAVTAQAVVMHAPESASYLEVVRRKESCPERDCFAEYFFLSNGTVIRKQFPTPDYETRPDFAVRAATPSAVLSLQATAAAFIKAHPAAQKWSVDSDKLYLSDGGKISTYSDEATPAFDALLATAQNVFKEAAPAPEADDFFLHTYYQLTGGDIADFHVFAGGTVVFSWFKRRSDEMKTSDISTLDEETFSALRQLAKTAAEAGVAPAPYRQCDARSGIDYALMEIRNSGGYVKSYLCPGDASPLTKTFEFLRARQK